MLPKLLAHRSCKETRPSRLALIPQSRSQFRMTVLRVLRLAVVLSRPVVLLIGVSGCAHLIGLLCFLLRHRASQLGDLGVVQWFDRS